MKDSFHFLRANADKSYTETYGVDFEDFEPGQIFEHRPGITLTEAECAAHARKALDLHPQYSDRVFAEAVYGGKRPVMEAYVLSLLALTTKTFAKVVANLSIINFEMHPVYVGDTLYFSSEILSARLSASRPGQGILHIVSQAVNQNGDPACAFERKLLIYRKDMGPYEAAGY